MTSRKFIKLKDVMDRTGLPRSTIYLRMSQGVFPKPVSLGCATSRWVEDEVAEWMESRIRARDASAAQISC
jgi:prophage regulatory protein